MGETFYKAQLRVIKRVRELATQGIIVSISTNTMWQIWTNTSAAGTFVPTVNATCGNTLITWVNWNEQYTIHAGQIIVPASISPEERVHREAQAKAFLEERDRKEAERKAAEIKAEKLLHSCLTEEQKDELIKKNYFHLYVGNKKYRIERGTTGNIKLLYENSDNPKHQYCIHPTGVPVGDVMLAQKLLLETNEEEFLRVANRHW